MTGTARLRRRVDRRLYRLLYRTERLLLPTDVGPGPIDGAALRRVLVFPNYKVGDLVVATPALTYLREAAPHARIDVVVAPRTASLLDGDPRVDRVLLHDPLREPWLPLAHRLRAEHYDCVIDLVLPHHAREGLLVAAIAGRRGARVTPFRPTRYWGLFTHRPRVPGLERRYMAERMLYAVQAAILASPRATASQTPAVPNASPLARIEAALARYPMTLTVAPEAAARVDAFIAAHVAGPFAAVNTWASDARRDLAVDQAGAMLAMLGARHPDLTFVLTPPPGADARAHAMAAAAGPAARVVVFPSSPRLPDLVALLARSTLVLSTDTGTVHLAAGVGRPVVVLFTTLATARVAHWIPTGRATSGRRARGPVTDRRARAGASGRRIRRTSRGMHRDGARSGGRVAARHRADRAVSSGLTTRTGRGATTAGARLRTRATRRLYRALFAAYRTLFPTRVAERPLDPAQVRRVLVARTDRVGDMVVLTPALSYLRTRLPNVELDVIASAANASLIADDPRVTRVHVHEPTWRGWLRSVRTLRARRYDAVLTIRFRDHLYEGIFAALVAGRDGARVTIRRPPQYAGLFTHQVRLPPSRAHVVARMFTLVRATFGDLPAPPAADDLAAFPPALRTAPAAAARARAFAADALGGRPYVALNAWGRDPRRSFEPDYAAALAAAVVRHRPALAVVVTPPPGREAEAATIAHDAIRDARAAGTAQDPIVVAAPASRDLADLVAILRGAAVVLTPDTANVHLASALGVPLVAVYTPLAVHEREWGAWGTPRRVVRLDEPRPLRDVPVDEVAAACAALFDGVASSA